MKSPAPADIIKLRQAVQQRDKMGATAATDACAAMIYSARRTWQHWESGDRKMHPGLWELALIKSGIDLP